MNKIKSPYNWVGNKYKYIDIINNLISDKRYNSVIEPMLGSGNILLNIQCQTNIFYGNDIIKLIPNIYTFLMNNDITKMISQISLLNITTLTIKNIIIVLETTGILFILKTL